MNKKPLMLIILDGLGLGKEYEGNAFYRANTPNIDKLLREYPNTSIDASGLAVGLPDGQMGNSEVGHLNIGAGRVVYQELTRITKSIEDGSFYQEDKLLKSIENARVNKSKIHLVGLVSEGGVHSHINHLYGLLNLMKKEDFKDVFIHVILDGRDVGPKDGLRDIEGLLDKIEEIGIGQIASISGRYYSMDRDNRWDRIKLSYDAMTQGRGNRSDNPIEAVEESYKSQVTDEFILPTVIERNGKPIGLVEDDDSIIFFNFRPDRARELTRAFVDEDFTGFDRDKIRVHYTTMTEYDKTIENVNVVFTNEPPKNTLGEYISARGLNQLRSAETEKYAHVTFFFNGGREEAFPNEDRVLIQSPKVATYDLQPEMSAYELKDEIINRLEMDRYDLIVLNFANPDMVGHSGIVDASIKAVETVDTCLGEILDKLEEKNGLALITADHGNVESLIDEETGGKITAHTTNQVFLILYGDKDKDLIDGGKLADLAPTILDLLELDKPIEMTGNSLVKKHN